MTTSESLASGAAGPDPELLDQLAVRRASSTVAGMVLFVASEAVFFAAFLGIYAVSYAAVRVWPPAGITGPPLVLPTVGVIVLLASGAAIGRAMSLARRRDYHRGITIWLTAGLAGAVIFTVLLAIGYASIPFGVGQGIYESLFYMITGLELAHGVGGALLLAVVLVRGLSGELALRRDPVLSAAIYWYFVVGLGVVIYSLLYLGAIR